DLSGDPAFGELLGRARETALGAYAHQEVPFERLVEEVRPERDLSRNPLFQVMLVLDEEAAAPPAPAGLDVEPLSLASGASKFDLSLYFVEEEGALRGEAVFATDLFDRATVQRMTSALTELLTAAAADPTTPLGALPLMGPAEERRILRAGVGSAEPAADRPLPVLVGEQASRTPRAVAVDD
ncbi:hypothetical protein GTW69_03085, partial [Streptomyces sp. SID7760]|nr:hypothetical protein [Streptomyces sp. SID7760]